MSFSRSVRNNDGIKRKETTMPEMPASERLLLAKNLRGVLVGLWIIGLAALPLCQGCASHVKPGPLLDEAGTVEKLGIRPVAIRLTAAGNMIDFRYRVIDPDKSLPMFNRQIATYLLDQASGDRYAVPTDTKLGPLRSSSRDPVAGKEYFILFVNPGKVLKRGRKVSVVIGDMEIENLSLE